MIATLRVIKWKSTNFQFLTTILLRVNFKLNKSKTAMLPFIQDIISLFVYTRHNFCNELEWKHKFNLQ